MLKLQETAKLFLLSPILLTCRCMNRCSPIDQAFFSTPHQAATTAFYTLSDQVFLKACHTCAPYLRFFFLATLYLLTFIYDSHSRPTNTADMVWSSESHPTFNVLRFPPPEPRRHGDHMHCTRRGLGITADARDDYRQLN